MLLLLRRPAHLPRTLRIRRSLATTSTEIEVTDPLLRYQGLVASGRAKWDEEQVRALMQIRKVHENLLDYQPPIRLLTLLESLRPSSDPLYSQPQSWPFQRSPLSNLGVGLLPSEESERIALLQMSEGEKSKALVRVLKDAEGLEDLDTPKGFFLVGQPGTGKSFLMDIFFHSLPIAHKARFHYHHFLLSIYGKVHDALERQRLENEEEERVMNEKAGPEGYPWSRREEMKAQALAKGWRSVFAGGRAPNDPELNTREFVLVGVARDLIKDYGFVLAFDEVQLLDIAGAGMINRVLSWYWRLGGVVVGTSNRVPEDLYNSGVQKESISSFLIALSSRSPVISLSSPIDYRRQERSTLPSLSDSSSTPTAEELGTVDAWLRWGGSSRGWFVKGEEKEFQEAVARIIGEGTAGEQRKLKVYGRDLIVPWAYGGVAKFTFGELCEKALGPADYITLASSFHTIILTDVPVILLNAKNEARRLITLLDSLYETKTRLLVFAESPIDTLFFPDAIKGTSLPPSTYSPDDTVAPTSAPDDITTSSGSAHPFSSARIYSEDDTPKFGQDAAGEVGDSLTEEMIGDVMQDLEMPFRPNISSYDASKEIGKYGEEERREERVARERRVEREKERERGRKRTTPHPSASTPSFQSLAIFTGEEERFAFKRAVSRVYEMSSPEYLLTATWTPLDSSFRTWERPSPSSLATSRKKITTPSRDAIGPKAPLGTAVEDKLSGVLDPGEMRLKWPEGRPKVGREVDVKEFRKGEKFDPMQVDDPKKDLPPPKEIKGDHVWGVREDWGEKAGAWGKGAKVFEGKEEKK